MLKSPVGQSGKQGNPDSLDPFAWEIASRAWLKAFAETDGDEKVAKARYIKYRIDQLKEAQGG